MDSTSIQEQDSSVIPTSLFLLSSLLLVSATSENNSHKEGEGVGEEGEGNAGVGEGVGNAGHVGDVGKKVQNLHVTFDTIPNPNPNPISPISKNPAQGQSPAQSPSTGQSLEEDKYSNLIAAITQHYMRTYKDTSLRLESLDTIFKHNVNNLEK